jgi:deoxyribonuclease V
MKIKKLHGWDISLDKAADIQLGLRSRLRFDKLAATPLLVAGADVSASKGSPEIFASVVVVKLPEMEIVGRAYASGTAMFPYVPGFLAFREVPILLEAFARLDLRPDAVICDGHGIAHPRGLGLASHLGLFLDLPTVGCAKSLLVGEHRPVSDKRWSRGVIEYKGEIVGAALRTRKGVKPVYVSPGHKIDLENSLELVRRSVGRYRLPETTRLAHAEVNRLRRGEL